MQYGNSDFAVTTPNGPRRSTVPFSPAAPCARAVRYGPASTVTTVVWKAEFAQSYIVQPKISRRSLRIKLSRLPHRHAELACDPYERPTIEHGVGSDAVY